MKFSLSFPAHLLKAISKFAPEHDIRYYLKGVHVEPHDGGVILVATSGLILGALRVLPEFEGDTPAPFIIPNDAVKAAIRMAGQHIVTITLERAKGAEWGTVTVSFFGQSAAFPEVGGVFLDWRRVVPPGVSGEVGNYDPRLLALFTDAEAALPKMRSRKHSGGDLTSVAVHQNGPKGIALVGIGRLGDDFVGAIAPLKVEGIFDVPPWARKENV